MVRLLREARPTVTVVTRSITAASAARPQVDMLGAVVTEDEEGPVVPEDVPLPVPEGATMLTFTVAALLTGRVSDATNWKLPVPWNPAVGVNSTSMVPGASDPETNRTVPFTVLTIPQPTFGSGSPVRCRVMVTAVSVVVLAAWDSAVNLNVVIASEGSELAPVPLSFVAVTVKVYSVPLARPVTTVDAPEVVAVTPPGADATV